jgi:SCP-2 sterol transfer family
MPHPFLSEDWMAEAKAIRARYEGQTSKVTLAMKLNQVVTGVPFGEGTVESYLDTTSGDVVMDLGRLDDADVTVTTDYATAKAIFVDQDPAAGMQAFMTGRITVQGDMMKLMAMQTAMPNDETSQKIAEEIKAITADVPAPSP